MTDLETAAEAVRNAHAAYEEARARLRAAKEAVFGAEVALDHAGERKIDAYKALDAVILAERDT